MPMTDEQKLHFEAVHLILTGLFTEAREAYRNELRADRELLQNRAAAGFAVVEDHDLIKIKRKASGKLPDRKFLYVGSPKHTRDPITGIWLRWDFEQTPYEFRLFLGHWSKVEEDRSFVAFRFDAPEVGEDHNFFHCQPCRNFGDRDPVPKAALVSEHFPTVPLLASDIVELTICAVKALKGQKDAKSFLSGLIRDSGSASNRALGDAYVRHFNIKPTVVLAAEPRG